MSRTWAMLVPVAVAAGLLVAPAAPAVAATPTLAVSGPAPVAGTSFVVKGRVSTSFARFVRLQRYTDHAWRTVQSKRSSSAGGYAFRLSSSATRVTLRAYVPSVRHRGKTYASRRSTTLRVTQSVPLPPMSGTVETTAPDDDGRMSATAHVSPAAPGATVTFAHEAGSSWTTDATAEQDDEGTATATFDAPDPGEHTFRATVAGFSGSATAASTIAAPPTACPAPAASTPEPDDPTPTGPDQVARVDITTDDGAVVSSHDVYSHATLTITPRDSGLPAANVAANLRVRGNSTSWISTKYSYKVKLDAKASLGGMTKSKNWVLLANFYDRSMLRNEAAFEISRRLRLPWTPRMRFAEVWLNGSYRGLYQLGQGVEAEAGRVTVPSGGYLLEADSWPDDKPSFTTSRGLTVHLKDPDTVTPEQKADVVAKVQAVEDSMYGPDADNPWRGYARHVDVDSFVGWYLVNEAMKNIDSSFNNSIVMVLSPDGCLSMGPVWDFDQAAGNRADWGTDSPRGWFVRRNWTTDPAPGQLWSPSQMRGAEGHWLNRLLADPRFVDRVEQRWRTASLSGVPAYVDTLASRTTAAALRNFAQGDGGNGLPIGPTFLDPPPDHVYSTSHTYAGEVALLRDWLEQRIAWMDDQLDD